MLRSHYKLRLLVTAAFLLVISLASACAAPVDDDFDSHLNKVAEPYRFDFLGWEVEALSREVGLFFAGEPESADNITAVFDEFFENTERLRVLRAHLSAIDDSQRTGDPTPFQQELDELRLRNDRLSDDVERQIETQIREVLSQQGIYSPLDRCVELEIGFPPVNFHLGRPPHLLVISPRDRIESIREVALLPDMSVEEMEHIEAELDSYGVSSLVVGLGGMATYPSYVTDEADLGFIVEAAAEEWLHQYLAFTPLGLLYLLDLSRIRPDYEIATMNETVVGIVSEEIGALVLKQYYGIEEQEPVPITGFDFNKEMRETRRTVDEYLANGQIEEAEAYMEERRQYLAENRYYIRKLNQAYFAFHGAYADSPTSISPIGAELKELRKRSLTLKDFLEEAAGMTSRRELSDRAK